jgi:23S rRNA (adenine2503-C2)-methyltransferase
LHKSTTPAGRYGISRADLARVLAGQPAYRVEQVWRGLYDQLLEPDEMTNLPRQLRAELNAMPELSPQLTLDRETVSDGGQTRKWLFSLADGSRIETVLMHYPGRTTVCVSSQAGCALACSFCATGQAGFTRHLASGEIVEQVVRAARAARASDRRLGNVVFMGMGEPFANYGRVWCAVERLNEDLGLAARHLTISTVGMIPGIVRLSKERLQVNLAVSLHAANDELRDQLVPINRRYPIARLMDACAEYLDQTRRRVSFEWALIEGVNDRPSDSAELAALARPLGAHVNLIPLNSTPGYPAKGTPRARVTAFRAELLGAGVNATVRQNRGTDIAAACGQLAAERPPIAT